LRESQDVSAVLLVGKALAIIEALLQASKPLSAREIGERSGVNRTTAHRLLNTLILHGWVERHVEGGYRLSVKFLARAHVSVQVRGLFDEIRPALLPLSELSRETIHVGVIGVRCLGAAICGAGGSPLFAVSITGPSPRFTLEACARLAPTLLSVAGRLSHTFGGGPVTVNHAINGRDWNVA
jgi:DNA-binding IclR family transcriptional regulator